MAVLRNRRPPRMHLGCADPLLKNRFRVQSGRVIIEILKPCAEWKLRGKLWKAWRERENRIGVKIEGAQLLKASSSPVGDARRSNCRHY